MWRSARVCTCVWVRGWPGWRGQAVLRELVNRVERIEITGEPRWTTNSSLRGLEELRVRAVPR